MSDIIVKGAREHNLQDVDLVLPRNKLICFTGVSGLVFFGEIACNTKKRSTNHDFHHCPAASDFSGGK